MKRILISDEKEGVYLYSGMMLSKSYIDPLERIQGRLLDKIVELEGDSPTSEGTRSIAIENSIRSLLKAQDETTKILEETQNDVLCLSRRLDLNRRARGKLDEAIDKNHNLIEKVAGILALNHQVARKRDERISDIEEFQGDF